MQLAMVLKSLRGGVLREAKSSLDGFINTESKNDYRCFDPRKALIELYSQNRYFHVMAWAKIYKRTLFNDIEFPVGKLHEDMAIMYKLYEKCSVITGTTRPVYFVRQREGSITRSSYKKFRMKCWMEYYFAPIDYYKSRDNDIYRAVCTGYLRDCLPYYAMAYRAHDTETKKLLRNKYRECFTFHSLFSLSKRAILYSIMFMVMPDTTVRLLYF